jgi:isocitrate dehydrogenase
VRAIAVIIKGKKETCDLARIMEDAQKPKTSGFAGVITANMD